VHSQLDVNGRLDAGLHRAPFAVSLWLRADGTFRLVDINDAGCAFAGVERGQLLGATLELFNGNHARGRRDMLEALASDTAHRPLALDHPRREDAGEPPQGIAVTEEHGFAEVEDAVAVDSLLEQLPARDRLIVELRFRDDMLQREIATLLGISQMQVSRVLARSIATLRELAAAP